MELPLPLKFIREKIGKKLNRLTGKIGAIVKVKMSKDKMSNKSKNKLRKNVSKNKLRTK